MFYVRKMSACQAMTMLERGSSERKREASVPHTAHPTQKTEFQASPKGKDGCDGGRMEHCELLEFGSYKALGLSIK